MLSKVEREVTVYCPVCGALETLVVVDGVVTPSTHWRLNGSSIYHRSCGAACKTFGNQRG